MDDAINELGTSGAENNASSLLLSNQLAWLNNAIHLLDHRKGEAEKKFARVLDDVHRAGEQGDNVEMVREAENEVREMEQLHDEYVERIGRLRDRVVIEIDRLLGEHALTNERALCSGLQRGRKS
ncbi:MAG: hypothetical protein ACKVQW_06605 [Pyrinomonadaceae bacterium]